MENSEIYAWISIVQLGGTLPRLITQPKVGLRQQNCQNLTQLDGEVGMGFDKKKDKY